MFRNLCLFAHFDQDNILADYVPYYLEAIRAAGFDIVVISTSDLSADDILRLRSVAHDVILRENNGHDFASWALGIERYASLVSGQLMIANDSVYGPIGDLIRAIERLTSVSSDVYGMIESREINRHLQSWFIIFEPHVHASLAFKSVFRQPFHQMSKSEIIRKGEVGLSQSLIANGYNIRALFDGNFNNGQRLRISSNTSHFLWRELIENEDIPFLKIELLRVNPCRIGSISRWIDVVAAKRPELVPMIKDHLVRTSKGRKDDAASPRCGPASRNDPEFFVGRDYVYAAAGRRTASLINYIYSRFYSLKRMILRHI
ncbi:MULTISPECIES: rhamnan synthesis F family protein [Hyphomicrobiales]|uniref:rhamnan synthesis F family protein n=1 Tax=Hyphomicrobiales TaxID=356 RepID=UPI003B02B524